MCYKYFQKYLIITGIIVNARIQNIMGFFKENDCKLFEIKNASNDYDTYNKVNDNNFRKPQRIHHNTSPSTSVVTVSNPKLVSKCINIYKRININASRTSRNANDFLENYRPESVAVTKFLDKLTRSSSVTTIENTTWRYQGSKNSEEIDDSKSTLIDYPFSVSIQRKGAHYVTGALLDKWWIITSASEFYHIRESLKLFRARLGSVDCKRGGVVIPIKKTEIHPYYIHGKPNFDVALLKLAYPVEFGDYIRPIAISNINAKVISAKFMTTYWPRILVKGSALPLDARERIQYNSMRVSIQRLIPGQMCTRALATFNEILNEPSLCLKPVVTHHSVCMPDAGAPVVAEDGLWGITSGWIIPTCPKIAAPTIFTRLSSPSVRSWLDKELLSL